MISNWARFPREFWGPFRAHPFTSFPGQSFYWRWTYSILNYCPIFYCTSTRTTYMSTGPACPRPGRHRRPRQGQVADLCLACIMCWTTRLPNRTKISMAKLCECIALLQKVCIISCKCYSCKFSCKLYFLQSLYELFDLSWPRLEAGEIMFTYYIYIYIYYNYTYMCIIYVYIYIYIYI